jgi:RNA polymerase sigma-70 factor (ECF subfamily)
MGDLGFMSPDHSSLPFPNFQQSRPARTRWSLVRRAAGTGNEATTALGEILSHYWYPLYAWARHRGMTADDAADAVQSFVEVIIAENLLASAHEERGRLRGLLLVAFQRHVSDQDRRSKAQKRGGSAPHLSIDWRGAESIYASEPALRETPEALYTRAWAVSLMEEAVVRLTAHYEQSGRGELLAALLPALESPLPDATYAQIAPSLGLTSGALRSAAVRLRKRYRLILLELASARLGITSEAALEAELRELLRAST